MINDTLKATGQVTFKLTGEDGKVKETTVHNLVVTVGKNFIASRMASAASAVMAYMAVGTSGTAAALGDTTLGGELARIALSSAVASTNTVVYSATFVPGVGTGTLQEAGLFDLNAAGTMLCRTVYTGIPKGAGDTLAVTWTITIN